MSGHFVAGVGAKCHGAHWLAASCHWTEVPEIVKLTVLFEETTNSEFYVLKTRQFPKDLVRRVLLIFECAPSALIPRTTGRLQLRGLEHSRSGRDAEVYGRGPTGAALNAVDSTATTSHTGEEH